MAYIVNQAAFLNEDFVVNGAGGTLKVTTNINLNDFERQYRALLGDLNQCKSEGVYDKCVLSIVKLIFGETGAQEIVEFYNSDYVSILVDVTPFIVNVVFPSLQKYIKSGKSKQKKRFFRHR